MSVLDFGIAEPFMKSSLNPDFSLLFNKIVLKNYLKFLSLHSCAATPIAKLWVQLSFRSSHTDENTHKNLKVFLIVRY